MDPFQTNVTKTVHRTPYPAIDPSRPELSQAGKTVLITGGTAGIGYATAKAFITAGVSTIIITGRRKTQLDIAVAGLNTHIAETKSSARVIAENSDGSDLAAIDQLWASLAEKDVFVDVLILNAAKFAEVKPLLDLGVEHVWTSFETNVKGPLRFSEKFYKQAGASARPQFLINVSTQAINMSNAHCDIPLAAERPEYGLTKGAGTLAIQYVAQDVKPEDLQVVSIHPGVVYSQAWELAGAPPDMLAFDDETLPAGHAVWAATKEAAFLHGRFVWSSWDVTELAQGEVRKRIESDGDFLRVSVGGLHGANIY
ncbi:putative short-chain dehydrogenase [Lasiosphaeris hirsuta]|uniref:Short-chain dehydrogenase n=1 Tax=Lasiosphaeris hirsuta TaxID=260670 RepID=A0AA40ANK8_9PEZI|nr:putative short-chain dehydrogenase [Lasiosphaeris hirsuta]